MINDDFDKKIYNYFKENNYIPPKTIESIYAVNLSQKKSPILLSIKKIVITIISLLTISTGFVFAKDIERFIKNYFSASKGVETAIENNYIYENPEFNYSTYENTSFRINSVVMDDFNINLSIVANFANDINLSDYNKIYFPDMIILDEEENIIFFSNFNSLKNYYTEKNLDYNFDYIYNNSVTPSTTIFMEDISESNATIICNMMSSDKTFPKSKELYVNFKTIELVGNNRTLNLSGDWCINISIPEKFYNRQTQIYNFKNCNDSRVFNDSVQAYVSQTGMKFKMELDWGTFKEYSMEEKQQNILNTILIKDEYVINSKGEKFFPSKSSDSDGGYTERSDGTLVYWQTFDFTTYDLTDSITIVLQTNESSEIRIELEK